MIILTKIVVTGSHQLTVVVNKEEIMDEAIIKIKYYDLEDVVALLAQNDIRFELFTHTNKNDWLPSDWESSSC